VPWKNSIPQAVTITHHTTVSKKPSSKSLRELSPATGEANPEKILVKNVKPDETKKNT